MKCKALYIFFHPLDVVLENRWGLVGEPEPKTLRHLWCKMVALLKHRGRVRRQKEPALGF